MDSEKCIGWIKFHYRGDKNHFKGKRQLLFFLLSNKYVDTYTSINISVTEIDPKDLISDSILNKFHETQDTQALLCSICQNLPRN